MNLPIDGQDLSPSKQYMPYKPKKPVRVSSSNAYPHYKQDYPESSAESEVNYPVNGFTHLYDPDNRRKWK